MIEEVLIVLAAVAGGVSALFKWRLPKQLRALTFGRGNYVRFYPNPGVAIGDFHWCRNRGRGTH